MLPLAIMFNPLFEQFSDCQSLLKERRQLSTGGLREAFKEYLEGVSMTSFPCVRSKTTFGTSVTRFSST